MSIISFNTKLFKVGSWTILQLPKTASAKLPSRGMTMVKGTINDVPFQIPLEPDGDGSHWLQIDKTMQDTANTHAGDTVKVEIESTKNWPEPTVPADLQKALIAHPQAHALWNKVTPMAHWDWLRWINSTKEAKTRSRRIEVACSKLKNGMRRPCCFNRSMCCVPDVSKNGVLIVPDKTN